MTTNHLTNYEQEDYLLGERTSRMLHHLAECSACQANVTHLQQTLGNLRTVAVEYSATSLAQHPLAKLSAVDRPTSFFAPRWAFAAVLPLLLLLLTLLPVHPSGTAPAHPAVSLSDDALLDQVDEQLSVTVPSSMESLTHLVAVDKTTRKVSLAE